MRSFTTLLISFIFFSFIAITITQAETLKLGHVYPTDHPWHKGSILAADQIKEKTNGRITVEVFPLSQLGTEAELLESVLLGSVDIAVLGTAQIGNMYKVFGVTEMPYLFRDIDHTRLFQESDIAADMFEKFRKKHGGKILATGTWGIRHLTANKAVRSPEDLKRFKLRVPEQQVPLAYGEAMGASPTPIAYKEAYMALQQEVVDGLENPLTAIKSMKFYEVQKYINLTGHVTNVCTYTANDSKFQSFSAEDQKIIMDAFDAAVLHQNELIKNDDQNLVAFFEKQGLTVNKDVDVDAFMKATASMLVDFSDWWAEEYGADLPNRIQALK